MLSTGYYPQDLNVDYRDFFGVGVEGFTWDRVGFEVFIVYWIKLGFCKIEEPKENTGLIRGHFYCYPDISYPLVFNNRLMTSLLSYFTAKFQFFFNSSYFQLIMT